jgi:quinohemoprotein ethanol dehydrogenase
MADVTLSTKFRATVALALALLLGCVNPAAAAQTDDGASDYGRFRDDSDGRDWPAPGRTFGEQHFSPLTQVNRDSIGQLGLAWSFDLPVANSVTQPIAVLGVLYFTTGYSVVHAIDARSGKELWSYDPKAAAADPHKLALAWGSRGIAWWNGRVYTGTQDGRLIALDAATGKPVWSVQTTDQEDGRYITGAPRVFDGKVIVGHGGADTGSVRGYVTTYDAETGKQLWRFYIVPGNPANGFEDKAMEMASKTWFGQWWRYGGGGTVWNAISYDPETHTVFLGTGNGDPWNRKIRSQDKGDNLFLCSIVALDAQTGSYKWHYQLNPGESWDYNAAMDMEFANLTLGGKPRKVLLTAPKNGFLYVIDRTDGTLISAEPYAKVTWAKGIDRKTGRPVDSANNRYENGPFLLAPSPVGAHSWLPMAFSPRTGLVYIPAIDMEATYSDAGIDPKSWQRAPYYAVTGGVWPAIGAATGASLVAWNPVTQKQAWRIPKVANVSGGVVATGGNLVFQGDIDHRFDAYDAESGKLLWSYDAKAPVMGPPISYEVEGRQYITVLSGAGTSLVLWGPALAQYGIGYREQKRRVLTFALNGKGMLPDSPRYTFAAVADPDYRADPAAEKDGMMVYGGTCGMCHGAYGIAAGAAPDLRASPIILDERSFAAVVRDGLLLERGMPRFDTLPDKTRQDIRQYVRKLAHDASR